MGEINLKPLETSIQKLHASIEKSQQQTHVSFFHTIINTISVWWNAALVKKNIDEIKQGLQNKCEDISLKVTLMQSGNLKVDTKKLYDSISEVLEKTGFLRYFKVTLRDRIMVVQRPLKP